MRKTDNTYDKFAISTFGKGRIGRQLVLATIAFSSFITLLTTSYQLYGDYKNDLASIDGYFELIKNSYLESVTTSVWMYDEKQISSQLDGLIKIPDMEYLGIQTSDAHAWSSGSLRSKHRITHRFPLVFTHRNQAFEIGILSATASLDAVYSRLMGKAFSILISNAVRAFFVSCFILFIFHLLVTRRLIRLSAHVKNIDLEKQPVEIMVKRPKRKNGIDEIDRVVHALDRTQHKLFESYEALKQSQNGLKESHQRFLTVLDAIDAHIYVADMETYEILFMNTKMQKDFGGDFTGDVCWRSFRGQKGPCSHCTNSRLVDFNGDPGELLTWQGKNPLTERWYINHDRAIKWGDGRIVRLQIAMDITQYKKTEEDLRQAHKMEAIGTLAGGIAHDFNNMLGIILGNTELALEDIPEWHAARSNLEEIRTAGLRAKNVVRQLLSFCRKSEQKRVPLRLASVVEESMRLLRASIPSNIDIQTEIQDAHTPINADSTQIQQILINLCTNAVHAMEDNGGVLKLALTQKKIDAPMEFFNNKIPAGIYMSLMVSDTGKGIPPDIMGKIFDPYFTTKDVGKGSGLGLSIVHGIAANHDGGILVRSEPERGTAVEVLFPASPSAYIETKETKAELPNGDERILFVDDEESIVKVVSQMLDRLGYSVVARMNPGDALSVFKSAPDSFDLLITDMTMPNLTGDQLATEIKAVRSDIPIIICTGFSERMDEHKAGALEIASVLMKPIVRSEMAEMVRNVLDEAKN